MMSHPPPARCFFRLLHLGGVGGDTVIAKCPPGHIIFGSLCCSSNTCCFIPVLEETVDPIEAEFFIRKAQVSDARLGSPTARPRVDDGVSDAAVLQPAGFTAVQQLELPRGKQLTHFSHHRTVTDAGFYGLCIVDLLKAFEEVHFAWGKERKGKRRKRREEKEGKGKERGGMERIFKTSLT